MGFDGIYPLVMTVTRPMEHGRSYLVSFHINSMVDLSIAMFNYQRVSMRFNSTATGLVHLQFLLLHKLLSSSDPHPTVLTLFLAHHLEVLMEDSF